MSLSYYHVDTFATKPFQGNPAIVCILSEWLPDETLQQLAKEFNSMITAFLIYDGVDNRLRFFTLSKEVDLCGHGIIAAGYVVKHYLEESDTASSVVFSTNNEKIRVDLDSRISISLPMPELVDISIPNNIQSMIGFTPVKMFKSHDRYYAIMNSEEEIIEMTPNFELIKTLGLHGLVVSSASKEYDFVSRTFGPNIGVNEDYVTGTSHAGLVPYWAEVLNKQRFKARQLSSRPGDLLCELFDSNSVTISADCFLFARGECAKF